MATKESLEQRYNDLTNQANSQANHINEQTRILERIYGAMAEVKHQLENLDQPAQIGFQQDQQLPKTVLIKKKKRKWTRKN